MAMTITIRWVGDTQSPRPRHIHSLDDLTHRLANQNSIFFEQPRVEIESESETA